MRVYHLLARLAVDAVGPAPAILALAVLPRSRSISCVSGAAAVAVNMPRAKDTSIVAFVSRQPACTRAENQLAPVCRQEAMHSLGAWKSANVLTDHIALEAGFSNQAYQAQCVAVDYAGVEPQALQIARTKQPLKRPRSRLKKTQCFCLVHVQRNTS